MPDDQTIGSLFKAYDVRGIVPDELTPEIAYRIGRAIVVYLGCRFRSRSGETCAFLDQRFRRH